MRKAEKERDKGQNRIEKERERARKIQEDKRQKKYNRER